MENNLKKLKQLFIPHGLQIQNDIKIKEYTKNKQVGGSPTFIFKFQNKIIKDDVNKNYISTPVLNEINLNEIPLIEEPSTMNSFMIRNI